ncbi:hypothetical protein BX600DRAFT_484243 [Xylariales sp. PMI_506]|nr:hypothetical protein BX600DRAFT_484243 [Xylariales sp. PMI_506]
MVATQVLLAAAPLAVFAEPANSTDFWQVEPPIDYNDTLYAGWDQLKVVKEVEVFTGVLENRTYNHHPALFYLDGTVFLAHSSAPIDEDSMGQDVRVAASKDGGLTWTQSQTVVPAAMLPNQTQAMNFSYWCNLGIAQRAWQPTSFLYLPDHDELYTIVQSASIACPANYEAAGRMARLIDKSTGLPYGDPCWLVKNEYTTLQLYNETIFGTEYGMKDCSRTQEINEALLQPQQVPAWGSWLYNHELYAADDYHNMQEPTHALWIQDSTSPDGGYWQRFWRDISPTNNTLSVWAEFNHTSDGSQWYPSVKKQYGNLIYQTNIPDAKTKQYLGALETGDRYFISNPRYDATLARQPLTIAMSRGSDQAYRSIGVVRTNASTVIAPETRDQYKNHGFSYPTAVQVGDTLLVAYSENKENIWVSVVDIKDLPS